MNIFDMIKENRKTIFTIVFAVLFIAFIYNFKQVVKLLEIVLTIIRPFIYAFILAYILNPIVNLYSKAFKKKRGLSILATYITLIGLVILASNYLFPKLWANIVSLYRQIPELKDIVIEWATKLSKNKNISRIMTPEILNGLKNQVATIKVTDIVGVFTKSVINITVSTTATIINWVFGLVVSIYILRDKEFFKGFFSKFLRKTIGTKRTEHITSFLGNLNRMIKMYIGIKGIDSMIIGSIAFIGLSIMKSPLAILLAFIVFITNMIPYFGPFMGILIVSVVHLFYNPELAIISLIFLFLLQQFDGWYLDPKLIGGRVGLSPFVVIFGVTVAGKLFGPVGMLLASPVSATFKIYLDEFLRKRKVKA